MQEHIGDYFGKSLRHVLIDSYEAGEQTWSLNFRDDFKKLKGYDPVPIFLICMLVKISI